MRARRARGRRAWLPGWRGRRCGAGDRAAGDRGAAATHQATGGGDVRPRRGVRPSRSHRRLAVDHGGRGARRRSGLCGLEAVSHRVERIALGRVPGGAQAANQQSRWRRATGGPDTGLGDHDATRHQRRVAHRLACHPVPSDTDGRLRESHAAVAGTPSRAVGRPGVLSGVQPGERQPGAGIGSLRGTAMTPVQDVETLRDRTAPIDMSAASFRQNGHHLVDRIADWLEQMPDGLVVRQNTADGVRRALDATRGLPDTGTDGRTLLDEATELLLRHSLFNGHPRFFGYITSSPAPIGALGDLLASAINANVGAWRLAPMATEIEAQTIRWLAELIGFPRDAGGLLVSGGNMANFVGVLAARAAKAAHVRAGGVRAGATLRVYASTETHTWIQKAADLFGLGTDAIRWIRTDADQRMDVADLERQIVADRTNGDLPLLVVGTAGTVSTGAVDPLEAIAACCRRHDVWFHVDGAYGALAARVPGAPEDLRAIADADSVAVDPHKWLYAPLEVGCVLVRRSDDLLRAFSYHPTYYHFAQDVTNFFDYGPQNSRGFRALKVWLALRQVGSSGYERMIGDDMRLSRHLHALVQEHPDFEALTQHLSITTFRYVPCDLAGSPDAEDYLQRLNQELLSRLERSGDAFLSNAMVNGRFALRACIVNFRTSQADVEALLPLLSRLGAEADRALRP